jgi:UDP-GlcNAc3NAcA epimerase
MRSFNRQPEEVNRVLTDHCSDLLFAPTTNAVENLRSEGIKKGVHLVGDLMYDAVLQYGRIAEAKSRVLQMLELTTSHYALATVHRAENTDSADQLQIIVDGLKKVARSIQVIFPVHPRTRNAALRFGISLQAPGLRLVDPMGYLDMMMLQKHARAIITDSGGVQKEAFFHKVPCVTLRRETEWTELLSSGWNRLAPPVNAETVVTGVAAALASTPNAGNHLFGEGGSAERMADILLQHYTLCKYAHSR